MDPTTLLGGGIVAVTGLIYAYPKFKEFLATRSAKTLPHDHVKALIDYGTEKKCDAIVSASVTVGKLLYEECTEHVHPTPNNLP